MAQNKLSENVKTATTVISDVKEAITEKGVEIPEGTHATAYPEYIAKMTSQTELEEFKEQVVLKGHNESEVRVSAPAIELTATDGNINLNPTTGQVLYKETEIATKDDIPVIKTEGDGTKFLADDGDYQTLPFDNYLPLSGGSLSGKIWMNSNKLHLGSYKDGGVSALSVSNERGVLIESANKSAQYENVANIEIYAKDNGNIIFNTTTGKALYKDTEIATVDDLPDTSVFVDLTHNQTLANTKKFIFWWFHILKTYCKRRSFVKSLCSKYGR